MAMAALLLIAAACGDDSGGALLGVDAQASSDGDDDGLTPPPEDGDSDASGGSGDNDSGSSGGDGDGDSGGGDGGATGEGAGSQFCQFINQIDEDTNTVGDEIDTLEPSQLGSMYADIQGYIDQAVTMAPGPIQDDVRYLATTFADFNELMAEYEYDVFAMFGDPSVEGDPRFEAFDSGEFDAASDRVNAFCGIEDETSGSSAGDGDVPEVPGGDDMRAIIVSAYQEIFGWDEALANCVVDELGLDDPTGAIDPEVFSDLNAQICGQSVTELFGG